MPLFVKWNSIGIPIETGIVPRRSFISDSLDGGNKRQINYSIQGWGGRGAVDRYMICPHLLVDNHRVIEFISHSLDDTYFVPLVWARGHRRWTQHLYNFKFVICQHFARWRALSNAFNGSLILNVSLGLDSSHRVKYCGKLSGASVTSDR